MAFPVEIHTSNLRVREFAGDDLSRFLHLSLDSDAVRYLAFGPTSEAEARGMIEFVIGSTRALPRTQYVLAPDNAAEGYLAEPVSGVWPGASGQLTLDCDDGKRWHGA